MAQRTIIDIFTPPQFRRAKLRMDLLRASTGRDFRYSITGRMGIYHILQSLKVSGKILVPAYLCESVLVPFRRLHIEPIFYDIDLADLNGSIDSIRLLVKKYDITGVLAASLYGNSANVIEIEKFCKEEGIYIIDDAAQSFGAKLNGQYIGTFGDGGFFSFAPGKSTAGHLGAFFWTRNQEYTFPRTAHCLYHFFSYLHFYFNRLHIYRYKKFRIFQALSLFRRVLAKWGDIANDDICEFEKEILGGVLHTLFDGGFDFRVRFFGEFIARFEENTLFRIVKAVRGEPHPHKFVVVFHRKEMAQRFMAYLKSQGIFSLNGYPLLTRDLQFLPHCAMIDGKVVEIPIENDEKKMGYLMGTVGDFITLHA